MKQDKAKALIEKIYSYADIRINGDRPWDIRVRNEDLYRRFFRDGLIALGESYMDGWWDVEHLDQYFYKLRRADRSIHDHRDWRMTLQLVIQKLMNRQKGARAYQVAQRHYDLGNDLYKAMLDKRMVYSCGYWKDAKDLDQAQRDKLDLICRKLGLEKGMRVLDIGCGWGGFAKYAAEEYGVSVVGLTVSKEQAELARELCKGLSVEIRLQDYRRVQGTFDRVLSIGMFEHVGLKNYRKYMEVVHRVLTDEGLSLLHTLGGNVSSNGVQSPWMEKYIFPNSMTPSIKQIGSTVEKLFVMEDWQNFGFDYDKTLMSWFDNFNTHWDSLKSRYDERFYRMWKYYLLASAGTLRAREAQVWQIVLSKKGVEGGYRAIR